MSQVDNAFLTGELNVGKKLRMPASDAATTEQPQPVEPTVANQATVLLESDTPAEIEPSVETVTEVTQDPVAQDVGEQVAAAEVVSEPVTASEAVTESPAETPAATNPNYELTLAWNKAVAARWQNYRQWETDVEAAKERHTAAAITQAQIKEAHKIAKGAEEEALDELRDLIADQPKELVYTEFAAEFERKTQSSPAAPTQPAAAPAGPQSDAWRSVSITKLDLPEKLIERLQNDCINTMGQLEDRRGEISEHKAKWPKGIGAAKITQIEDAVIAWLTANRDQAVFHDLQGGHATEQPAEQPAVEETPTSTDAEATIKPDVTDEEFSAAINARAIELDDGTTGCLDDQLKAGYWHQGYDHYEAGGELRTCGLPPSPAQDDFIRGWLAAGQVEDYPDADEAEEEPPAGEEPELESVASGGFPCSEPAPELFNPDDI